VVGHLSEEFHEEGLGGGLLYWGTRKMRFLREMQNALYARLPLHRGPVGETGGGSFAGNFERKEKYIWVPFLDPEVIKILSLSEALASLRHTFLGSFFLDPQDISKISLGAIWNFGRNRAPLVWYRTWGTKGLS
jgi:hypothetical protein